MSYYVNDISNLDDIGQLVLCTATEDLAEDLVYEFLKDRVRLGRDLFSKLSDRVLVSPPGDS